MKIWLMIIFLISSSVVLAESQAETGSFTMSGATIVEDNFMNAGATTTNYDGDDTLVVGQNGGNELEILLDFVGLEDSMVGRIADSAMIMFTAESGQLTTHSIYMYTLIQAADEGTSSWNNAIGGGDPTPWNTGGAYGSGSDFRNVLIDSGEWSGLGNFTEYLDMKMAIDSGWFGGLVIRDHDLGSNIDYIMFSSDSGVGSKLVLMVYWTESSKIEPPTCSDAVFGTASIGGFSTFMAPSFDSYLDSMKVKYDDNNSAGDTIIHAVYRQQADSTLIEQSDTALLTANDACTYYMLQFDGTTTIKADSDYFWGSFVITNPNSWDFCVIGGATAGFGVTFVTGSPGIPANLQGAMSASPATENSVPCFTAYLTEIVAVELSPRRRRVLMGSCLEEEFILENDVLYRRIDDAYIETVDPVFGGIEKCGR